MNWTGTFLGIAGALMMGKVNGRSHWSIPVARLWGWISCLGSLGYSLAAHFNGPVLVAFLAAGIWMLAIPTMVVALGIWIYLPLKNTDNSRNWLPPIGAILSIVGSGLLALHLFQGWV